MHCTSPVPHALAAHRPETHVILAIVSAIAVAILAPATRVGAQAPLGYQPAVTGSPTLQLGPGLTLRVLVDSTIVSGLPAEMVEITFPVGGQARAHRHGATELIYVLSGTLEHVVNGTTHTLTAGMVGVVRAGDEVTHRVRSEVPVRALVIWTPSGELARVRPGLREQPPGP